MAARANNWIRGAGFDTLFILLPPFFCLLLILLFPGLRSNMHENNQWIWFLLIVCIDVGHVYSTIYRTYLDREAVTSNKLLFYGSPVMIYVIAVMLHSIDPLLFWRAMAYLAVFHFIRQQYGFMRLYCRLDTVPAWSRIIDTVTIYAATIYPMIYWHLEGKQEFNWFVDNDFLYLNKPQLIPVFQWIYFILLGVYFLKEIWLLITEKYLNLPKNLLMAGTILSWYVGIVYLKGDLTFTLLNVVSHGIPYYALVWAHGNKQNLETKKNRLLNFLFRPANVLFFVGLLIFLAYFEELLWDGFIWKEHFSVFPTTKILPDLSEQDRLLSLLIPLLALPQLLHYFIDGFIWKIRKDKFGWKNFLPGKVD